MSTTRSQFTDHPLPVLRDDTDYLLIGGGIMSATLGVMLKQLNPNATIQIIEALPSVALESSHAWNNAGTGHAALCELNYTPEKADGSVDISKAKGIFESFEVSKQFWTFLVEQGVLEKPGRFIRRVPHMSFVRGQDGVNFLKKRHEAMSQHHFFSEMRYTESQEELGKWAPLMSEGRLSSEPIAATRVGNGTDIDFGSLTKILIEHLTSLTGVSMALETEVRGMEQLKDGRWAVKVRRKGDLRSRVLKTNFVFIGAGGGSLPLLQKSGIPEGKGFGGFPVSGQFLVCNKPEIIERHAAKVYGRAEVGAPPMSVPHLDTRIIDGKKALLFGPYAGFSPKFLKTGSLFDMIASVKPDNIAPMLYAGKDNMSLTEYLYQQVMATHQDRVDVLREFMPEAKPGDWDLVNAGQRVQIIKKDAKKGGILQFGTEVVAAKDGSIAALLGASPGASTSVSIIIEVLEKCFQDLIDSDKGKSSIRKMIPSYGKSLADDAELFQSLRLRSRKALELGDPIPAPL